MSAYSSLTLPCFIVMVILFSIIKSFLLVLHYKNKVKKKTETKILLETKHLCCYPVLDSFLRYTIQITIFFLKTKKSLRHLYSSRSYFSTWLHSFDSDNVNFFFLTHSYFAQVNLRTTQDLPSKSDAKTREFWSEWTSVLWKFVRSQKLQSQKVI